MIGKIPSKRGDGKSSFHAIVSYCTAKDKPEVIYIGTQNILSLENAAAEMEALAFNNTRSKDPVFHAILAWREMELPTNKQVDEAVQIALKELNLEDCQALWALHANTQNRHVHIVVNKIDPETYKAIQPAGRWTHKALERAARKIELAQGWEVEQSGFYSVADGKLIEKGSKNEPAISSSARDGEAHTAIKSAERIVQEIAAPIIRDAKNWTELHEKLAEFGIAFEAKGSGAVLKIGEVIVKASKASRGASMSKLISRFGEYSPRPAELRIAERMTEPVEQAAKKEVRGEWERFKTAREEYFKGKKESRSAVCEQHKNERAALREQQKSERDAEFTGSWKGHGALLNHKRSVLAAKHAKEKLNLADTQKEELDNLKLQYPHRFISFKDWLEREKDQNTLLAFRYPNQGSIHGSGMRSDVQADLRAFTPTFGNKGGVAYSRDGAHAEFIDYGNKIVLGRKLDEAAILAALQLANQKWGSAIVNGTDEYKKICVELAIKHNLKISNPELIKEVENGKSHTPEQHKQEENIPVKNEQDKQAVSNQHASGTNNPDGAYWAHYKDIISRQSEGEKPDFPRIDGMVAVRMRVTGYSQGQIRSAIEKNAPIMRREAMSEPNFNSKYGSRDWGRYARETTENFVFGLRGLSQYEQSMKYRPRLMKIEGRDSTEERLRELETRAKEQQEEQGR
ncbi:relaxase [Synergistales bacterium]|nr:relaxase [Synergistales bacterium]